MSEASAASRRRGFTLVEMLVIVSIIALLVSILVPSLARAKELAARAACAANLHSIGRAWTIYFGDSDFRTPPLLNPWRRSDGRYTSDISSQSVNLIWAGDGYYGNTTMPAQWVNAGVLYGQNLLGTEQHYICPSVARNYGGPWFNPCNETDSRAPPPNLNDPKPPYVYWSDSYRTPNPWPVNHIYGSHMTYGTRRGKEYDDRSLAGCKSMDTGDDHIMFLETGVGGIKNTGRFAFMADGFCTPEMALLSHPPGVNVLNLGGNVDFYEDSAGTVLYDNALGTLPYGMAGNWVHDDIWMIIDGYHRPPAGQ